MLYAVSHWWLMRPKWKVQCRPPMTDMALNVLIKFIHWQHINHKIIRNLNLINGFLLHLTQNKSKTRNQSNSHFIKKIHAIKIYPFFTISKEHCKNRNFFFNRMGWYKPAAVLWYKDQMNWVLKINLITPPLQESLI